MRVHAFWNAFIVLLTMGVLVGCEDAPTDELDQALAALGRADSVEAARYAPDVYQEAQEALNAAEEAIEVEQYDEARRLLDTARATFNRAAQQTAQRKETWRTETATYLLETEDMLSSIGQAAQRTRSRSRRAALREEMDTLSAQMEAARVALEQGDVAAAHGEAASAHERATTILADLMKGKAG